MGRDDLIIKHQREKISTLRAELRTLKERTDGLDLQYKQVVVEQRRYIKSLIDNAPRAFFLYLRKKVLLLKQRLWK